MKTNEFERYFSFFEEGIYTEIEMLSRTLELLGHGDQELWDNIPKEIKDKIINYLDGISSETKFANIKPHNNRPTLDLIKLKKWVRLQ